MEIEKHWQAASGLDLDKIAEDWGLKRKIETDEELRGRLSTFFIKNPSVEDLDKFEAEQGVPITASTDAELQEKLLAAAAAMETEAIATMANAMKEVDRTYAPRYSTGPIELPADHHYYLNAMKIAAALKAWNKVMGTVTIDLAGISPENIKRFRSFWSDAIHDRKQKKTDDRRKDLGKRSQEPRY